MVYANLFAKIIILFLFPKSGIIMVKVKDYISSESTRDIVTETVLPCLTVV